LSGWGRLKIIATMPLNQYVTPRERERFLLIYAKNQFKSYYNDHGFPVYG
jgi:hypothetical protein